jgi:hypothetical protein
MIKLIAALLAPLLIAGSRIQAATAGERIAKRRCAITASKTIRNANASLAPLYTGPIFNRRNNVRYEHVSGQDDQPPRPSIYPPYMQGTCWDVGTCD